MTHAQRYKITAEVREYGALGAFEHATSTGTGHSREEAVRSAVNRLVEDGYETNGVVTAEGPF